MKTSDSQNNRQQQQAPSHKPRPEIRDNLDSRKNEEWLEKNGDVTHPEKEKKSERKHIKHQK